MKIIIVNTRHYLGGGDSTYAFNLAGLLRDHGHEVAFFAMQDERNLPDPNADLFVSHVDFRDLNRRRNLLTGLQVVGRSIYSLEARRKIGQLIDRVEPDLIHLQNFHAHITASIIGEARRRQLPVVWTLHDYKLICPNTHCLVDATGEICEACGKHAYYQAVLRRCKKGSLLASGVAALEAYAQWPMQVRKKVDAFLSPSSFLKKKCIEHGVPPERLHHLPLFLPASKFARATPSEGYLLFMAKLEKIKGIQILLEACRLAPTVKLILAGRVEEPLARALAELLPSNAQYVGHKQGQELEALRQNALAVVVPSICYENQPFSILEAFASGKPVIASNLGGMPELVRHEEFGLLVPPGDVNALAEAMRWVAAHPAVAGKMGKAAYQYALDTHGAENHYAQLMGICRRIMG